jgi:hypothetical protein
MTRSRSDVLLLIDCLQIAVTVAALVDLALPWWRYVKGDVGVGTTGWGALGDATYGNGWGLIGAVVFTGAAAAVRRRWAAITAAVLGVVGALIVLITGANVQRGGFEDAHAQAGLWVGGVLTLLAAGSQALAAKVLSRS